LEIKLNKQLRGLLAKENNIKRQPVITIGNLNVIILQGSDINDKSVSPKINPTQTNAILDYVNRLKSKVRKEYADRYIEIWTDILNQDEVKKRIYDRGKQQNTTFNRNMVAQIIHQMAPQVYVPTANTVVMAELLEPGKGVNHPVRQKLGEVPEKHIKKLIDETLKQYT